MTFAPDDRSFAFHDVTRRRWTVEPGEFEVRVGSSPRDIRLRGTLIRWKFQTGNPHMTNTHYDRLMELMNGLWIVDTHEHLPPESDRLARPRDFSFLFANYCSADLRACGVTEAEIQTFYGDTPLDEKWRWFQPYYERIQDGSYCRAAHLAMEKFYGFSRLTSAEDAAAVTAAMQKAAQPGLYRRVLKDACRIRRSLLFGQATEIAPEFFAPVIYFEDHVWANKDVIQRLEIKHHANCGSLARYVAAVAEDARSYKARGMKGIKWGLAYYRDLSFAPATYADAERVFNRVFHETHGWRPHSLGFEEARPLQDYMVHRIIEMAIELDVPVVFHAGILASKHPNPGDGRPSRLWNLFHRYPQANFVLLHGGLPWMEETALLAKYCPNVYLDLAWSHVISPALTRRALAAWIDLVPMHKILGFGGDYTVVEKVYGHLTLARQNIAAVLAEKMERDGLTASRAEAWIKAMLVENPTRVYQLNDGQ